MNWNDKFPQASDQFYYQFLKNFILTCSLIVSMIECQNLEDNSALKNPFQSLHETVCPQIIQFAVTLKKTLKKGREQQREFQKQNTIAVLLLLWHASLPFPEFSLNHQMPFLLRAHSASSTCTPHLSSPQSVRGSALPSSIPMGGSSLSLSTSRLPHCMNDLHSIFVLLSHNVEDLQLDSVFPVLSSAPNSSSACESLVLGLRASTESPLISQPSSPDRFCAAIAVLEKKLLPSFMTGLA
jgi:hypothetical protein